MKKIAIIDDEIVISDIIKDFLNRNEKYDITVFNNPLLALSRVKAGEFDLILLDVMMPEMNGIDFLKEVKTNGNSGSKVIVMTASSTLDIAFNCYDFGAEDYVTKPFISLTDIENKILDNI